MSDTPQANGNQPTNAQPAPATPGPASPPADPKKPGLSAIIHTDPPQWAKNVLWALGGLWVVYQLLFVAIYPRIEPYLDTLPIVGRILSHLALPVFNLLLASTWLRLGLKYKGRANSSIYGTGIALSQIAVSTIATLDYTNSPLRNAIAEGLIPEWVSPIRILISFPSILLWSYIASLYIYMGYTPSNTTKALEKLQLDTIERLGGLILQGADYHNKNDTEILRHVSEAFKNLIGTISNLDSQLEMQRRTIEGLKTQLAAMPKPTKPPAASNRKKKK